MLELAENLFQRNAIQEISLIKLAIAKSPVAIRSLLVKHIYNDVEWHCFTRSAKENAWIAFSSELCNPPEELLK
ncbi:hypothetical protein COBT_000249 [Conglomerata obtusa]